MLELWNDSLTVTGAHRYATVQTSKRRPSLHWGRLGRVETRLLAHNFLLALPLTLPSSSPRRIRPRTPALSHSPRVAQTTLPSVNMRHFLAR